MHDNGTVDFSEFLKMTTGKMGYAEGSSRGIEEVFKLFDNGKIWSCRISFRNLEPRPAWLRI